MADVPKKDGEEPKKVDSKGPYYAAMVERAEREAAGRPDLLGEPDPEVIRSFREIVAHSKDKAKGDPNSSVPPLPK